MAVTPSSQGLLVLRLCLGVFMLAQGYNKIGWLTDSGPLLKSLQDFLAASNSWNRPYLEAVCIPGVEVFARLVPIGELATGLALVVGLYTRWAALIALLMIVNFHFAGNFMFTWRYLSNGYGPPVIGGLLALVLGGAALPASLRK